ncbi:T4SS efffector SepA family protein [Agrobacterium vaccinii]|uniref:T4SS efffector SepA family protein n=1 Tax=Agrobacterium vaccinii TaxID=2735528 RepID=UPI001E467037|nr:hypothetical protein [Agrobacterium vaccinii]UHS56025.1 hypothetical protein HRS00_03955 [Agrobacterium vaccinii]
MMQISLQDEVFERLKGLAEPFVDTPESVIVRLIDAYTASYEAAADEGYKVFDPHAPPNLGFTTVISATINGKMLKRTDTYWNNILIVMIKHLAAKGLNPEEVASCITSNTKIGEVTNNGYKYIPEAGISVQGLDANTAWRTIERLAMVDGQSVDVKFRWQHKEGLENAGVIGAFRLTTHAAG